MEIDDQYVEYDEKRDGIEAFSYYQTPNFNGKFESRDPSIIALPKSKFAKNMVMTFPTKVVTKPKISGNYD